MNKERRKAIQEQSDIISSARDEIEMLMDEEQEYADNMPENMQTSEKREIAETAVNNLQEAVDSLESVIDLLNEAQE